MRPASSFRATLVALALCSSSAVFAAPLPFGAPAAAPAPTVAGVLTAMDISAQRLRTASVRLGRAEEGLLLALGFTDRANALRAAINGLEASAGGAEAEAMLRQVVLDPGIAEQILARAADQQALSEAAQQGVRDADGERFAAGVQVALITPEVANLAMQFTTLSQRILSGDQALVAEVALVAASPKAFVDAFKVRLDALSTAARDFGQQSRSVGEALKAVYKAKKVSPPDYKAVEANVRAAPF
jgi:hypothetical protein